MTTKLNVLQVIPKLGYGGAETGCYDIAHFLSENECGSFLATSGGELLKFVKKDKVKFITHCKEMPLAYSLADVVVSASIEPEAFGRVSVEAQSMGKPIIASNIGGSKETIINKKTGFLYKHDDPRELAKILNTVIQLSPDELKSIGNEGRKNITKKFDVETMCQSNLKEYRRLIKN